MYLVLLVFETFLSMNIIHSILLLKSNAALNTCGTHAQLSLGNILKSGNAGLQIMLSYLNEQDNARLFSKVFSKVFQSAFSPAVYKNSYGSTSSPTLDIPSLFHFCQPGRYTIISRYDLNLFFLGY